MMNRCIIGKKRLLNPKASLALGLYTFVVGFVNWALQRWLIHRAMALYLDWTAAYKPHEPSYNAPFVDYIVSVLTIVSGALLFIHLDNVPQRWRRLFCLAELLWPKAFLVAIICLLIAPPLSKALFFVSIIMFSWYALAADIAPPATPTSKAKIVTGALMMSMIILSVGIGAKAWYAVTLANDYVETSDTISIPPGEDGQTTAPSKLKHDDAIACLAEMDQKTHNDVFKDAETLSTNEEKTADKHSGAADIQVKSMSPLHKSETLTNSAHAHCGFDTTQQQIDLLRPALIDTSGWQSNAGRTLYHHAYIYVPAAHFLRYGLTSPIPYLYGLGNTLFHAVLMAGKPVTLTNYFNTFPLAQFIGILVIVGVVFYITRSWLAVPAALAMSLTPLWLIGPEAIYMAPGFSPLRYIGLGLQVGSMFVLSRQPTVLRLMLVGIALGFSLFWNKEFALFGMCGQILAVVAPSINLRPLFRAFGIALLGCIGATGTFMLAKTSSGFLETIQVGIFGVSVPPALSGYKFVELCLLVVAVACWLTHLALRFPLAERAPRLCVLQILALLPLKFIYNVSEVHLFYSLVFIAPFLLIYVDWQGRVVLPGNGASELRQRILHSAVLLATAICFVCSVRYYEKSRAGRALRTDPFVHYVWGGMGESLTTTIPPEPIETRMKSVRDEMRPDDVVLFLSPFDHLMSFYANPQKYCGHFELMTNLVTRQTITSVVECVKHNPHALVVYDSALDKGCPETGPQMAYYDGAACAAKRQMKLVLKSVMEELKPNLHIVKQSGNLSFYRHADAGQGQK
jgi:hypothetical protein